jgi:hypothetical protein
MVDIYIVVDENGKSYPFAFESYDDAKNEVIKVQDKLTKTEGYDEWRDDGLSEIDVEQGNKINEDNENPNETELYREKGMFITIYKLELKPNMETKPKQKTKPRRRHTIGGFHKINARKNKTRKGKN